MNVSTCAVCTQRIDWNGEAWEHQGTGAWASAPVRHRASPLPQPRPAVAIDGQDEDADQL